MTHHKYLGVTQGRISQLVAPDEPVKVARILHALASGRSLNRFQAESLSDHCLNTTISKLRRGSLLAINDKFEVVKGYEKLPTFCKRYWLSPEPEVLARAYWLLVDKWGYQLPARTKRPAIAVGGE